MKAILPFNESGRRRLQLAKARNRTISASTPPLAVDFERPAAVDGQVLGVVARLTEAVSVTRSQ